MTKFLEEERKVTPDQNGRIKNVVASVTQKVILKKLIVNKAIPSQLITGFYFLDKMVCVLDQVAPVIFLKTSRKVYF